LVVLIGSIGLAFGAFAAILPDGRKLRLAFAILSFLILFYAAYTWPSKSLRRLLCPAELLAP